MSEVTNQLLLERAYEAADALTSHPSGIDKSIYKAIEDNNLDEVRRLTTKAEAELAEMHFHNNNILEQTDVY